MRFEDLRIWILYDFPMSATHGRLESINTSLGGVPKTPVVEGHVTSEGIGGDQHPAPGTQHPAPSTRHPAPGTRHPAPAEAGTRNAPEVAHGVRAPCSGTALAKERTSWLKR
jgi:hypothetical protein